MLLKITELLQHSLWRTIYVCLKTHSSLSPSSIATIAAVVIAIAIAIAVVSFTLTTVRLPFLFLLYLSFSLLRLTSDFEISLDCNRARTVKSSYTTAGVSSVVLAYVMSMLFIRIKILVYLWWIKFFFFGSDFLQISSFWWWIWMLYSNWIWLSVLFILWVLWLVW